VNLGVCAVVAALPPLEATAAEGYPDGAAGALVCLVGPALEAGVGECVDDAVDRVAVRSWVDPGSAAEAHSRRPNGPVRTWTFMP